MRIDHAAMASAEGVERLPEGVIRVADRITMTAPTEGLGFVRSGDVNWHDGRIANWPFMFAYGGHGLETTVLYETELLAELGRFAGYGYGDIHLVAVPPKHQHHPHTYQSELTRGVHHPWRDHSWWRNNWLRAAEHFPVMSAKLPGLLSYFQTPEKRARDIRTPIKPGKYLRKFFGDVLTEEQIQTHAIEWHTWATPPELHVTQDADEIEEVYKHGPHSCMTFTRGDYRGSEHPARVYAGPDLAVAYLGEPSGAAARAVVWPERKIFGRIYGDYHRMGTALAAEGYRQGSDDEFFGARIRRIYEGCSCYTVPYCDMAYYAEDHGDYLVLGSSGEVYLRDTSGTNRERYSCASCGDNVDEDDTTYIDDFGDVCDFCRREYFFECSVTGDWFQDHRRVRSPDEYPVSDHAVNHHESSVFYCELTDMYYPAKHYNYVVINGDACCEEEHAKAIAFRSDFSKDWFLNEDKVELSDGRMLALGEWKHAPAAKILEWVGDAVEIGRDDHPDQLTFDADLAVAA